MQRIESGDELISKLRNDLCGKFARIVFIGGQAPLDYGTLEFNTRQWGMFSEYTFGMAVNTARMCKKTAKKNTDVVFALLVDDFTNVPAQTGFNVLNINNLMHVFYSKAKLPESYRAHLEECNLNENNIIHSNQLKEGREHCIYFSKKVLIATEQELHKNRYVVVYQSLIKKLRGSDPSKTCFVGFIPSQHREALSKAMHTSPFNWLNVYMPTNVEEIEDDTSNLERFYEAGVYCDFHFPHLA